MVDGAGLQVAFGHPERLLDLGQPVVCADHELRGHGRAVRAAPQVGDIALQARQGAGLGLELLAGLVVAVAAARCCGRGNEPGQQTWGAVGVGAPQVTMAVAAQD